MRKVLLVLIIGIFLLAGSAMAADFTLTWNAPTTNADGMPLTDLAGYKVYYGTVSKTYGIPIDVKNVLIYTITGLQSDKTYFFAVTAYDISRNESGFSNEISKIKPSIPTPPVLKNVLYTSLNNYFDVIVGEEIYKYMEIRNDSDGVVTISNIAIEGTDFRIVTKLPKILSAGNSTSFRVYFKPVEKGLRLGKISIVSDKGAIEKGLSGNGI